jgi:hypothetical protein
MKLKRRDVIGAGVLVVVLVGMVALLVLAGLRTLPGTPVA